MNKQILEKMATSAFDNLQKTRLNLFTAVEHTLTVKQDLEDAKTQAQIGGVFDGKNEEIRKAQAREHLQAEYQEVAMAEKVERRAMREFEQSQIEVDTVKTLLRIAELVEAGGRLT